jgi:hypothetical protein
VSRDGHGTRLRLLVTRRWLPPQYQPRFMSMTTTSTVGLKALVRVSL